jgi:hypothetical protein
MQGRQRVRAHFKACGIDISPHKMAIDMKAISYIFLIFFFLVYLLCSAENENAQLNPVAQNIPEKDATGT